MLDFFSQREWWSSSKAEGGLGKVKNLRMISESKGTVSRLYGVFKEDEHVAFRYLLRKIFIHSCEKVFKSY